MTLLFSLVLNTEAAALVIGLPRDQCFWQVLSIVLFSLGNHGTDNDVCIFFQGVKAVIAKSFERIHRSNLVGMGIIPLCFKAGEDADSLGLTGHERYNIELPTNLSEIRPGQDVTVTTDNGKSFTCILRFDTEVCAFQEYLPAFLSFFSFFLLIASPLNTVITSAVGGVGILQPWRYPSICHPKLGRRTELGHIPRFDSMKLMTDMPFIGGASWVADGVENLGYQGLC